MDIKSKLVKLGRDPKKQKGFINPGIYKGSSMIFNNFKHYLDDLKKNDDRKTLYGINSNLLLPQQTTELPCASDWLFLLFFA